MADTSTRLRIIVADDHPIFRKALVQILQTDRQVSVVAEVGDGRQALDVIRDKRPDVAVLDLQLPELDGMSVLDAVQREHLPTRMVVVSAFDDGPTAYRAMACGALAYLPKVVGAAEIREAILAVGRGATVIHPDITAGLAGEIRLRRDIDDRPVLSPRELDVLRLAADGESTHDIAAQLYLSQATVKTHLQHVYEKLEVSDRAAAVAQALRRGLLH